VTITVVDEDACKIDARSNAQVMMPAKQLGGVMFVC